MLSPPVPKPPPGATGGMAAAVDVDPLDPLELLGLGLGLGFIGQGLADAGARVSYLEVDPPLMVMRSVCCVQGPVAGASSVAASIARRWPAMRTPKGQ